MIDLNRFLNFDYLEKDERENLIYRVKINVKEVKKFLRSDSHEDYANKHKLVIKNVSHSNNF